MEVRCNSQDFNWSWDGNWMEMQIWTPWWRWNGTSMEVTQVSWDLDSCETGSGWKWHFNWMQVIHNYIDIYWGAMWFGWKDVNLGSWMEMEHKYWDLVVSWDLAWVESHILRSGYVEVELRLSGWAILLTWMDVRCEMDRCEMPTSWTDWRWDATWIEELGDMDRCEMVHGGGDTIILGMWGEEWPVWRWDVHFHM